MIACDQPPIVRRLKVSNIGETYATLQWQLSGSHGGYYGLELNYKQKGEVPSTQYQLSKWETLAVVRNLEANTTYLATLFTANQCARTDPAFTTFRTKATTLHPNLFKVMPHEIILTAVVMFIWMLIVRHFFKMYSHVAMVNPVTYGGYRMGAGEEEQAHTSSSSLSMKTPRTSLVPSSGNATLGSIQDNRGRSSTINSRAGLLRKHSSHSLHSHHTHPAIPPEERAALLAGAVEKWRSEAVLAHMEGIAVAATPVRSSLMRTAQSWTDIRQEGGKKKRRRCSTMSAPKHSAVPVVQLSIEEEDEEELESEDVDGDTGGDTGERKDSKDSIGSFSRPKQPWRSASLHVSSTEPERKRKSKQEPTEISLKQSNDRCQISSLLLGKATTDIRRCSSPPDFDGAHMSRLQEMAEEQPKLGRLKFFSSLRRKTQKAPPKTQMTMVTEEDDANTDDVTNNSDPFRDYNEHYRTDIQFEPLRVGFQRGKLRRSPASGYRQDSNDSYVTASEFLGRHIDSPLSTERV